MITSKLNVLTNLHHGMRPWNTFSMQHSGDLRNQAALFYQTKCCCLKSKQHTTEQICLASYFCVYEYRRQLSVFVFSIWNNSLFGWKKHVFVPTLIVFILFLWTGYLKYVADNVVVVIKNSPIHHSYQTCVSDSARKRHWGYANSLAVFDINNIV